MVEGLQLAGVSKKFGRNEALSLIDLSLPAGSFTAVIGPSGCGKSTLLRVISGLEFPDRGQVSLAGSSPEELRRQGKIGMSFQDSALLPWRTVCENIALPLQVLRRYHANERASIFALVDLVGLSGFGGGIGDGSDTPAARRAICLSRLDPEAPDEPRAGANMAERSTNDRASDPWN
jgi:NitT/TauT family transport system ATP-binding protein